MRFRVQIISVLHCTGSQNIAIFSGDPSKVAIWRGSVGQVVLECTWLRAVARRKGCFLTGMFDIPNSPSHVTSAAFAQARLSSAQVSSGLLRPAHPTYARVVSENV
jgi:hypothetical protein